MNENTPLLQNQSHILPRNRLLVIFPALALIQFTSFLDQTAISTSLPAIASGTHAEASISLIGASFLITSTSIQLINGRLSDIFGRRACLAMALIVMGIGNLLSGFCTTPAELFVSRAFTGFGAGAINALVQIAIADITTLEQRGYYFGMVGVAVALGNGLGPAIGGLLTQSMGWQWSFWFICPLTALAVGYLLYVWPLSRPAASHNNTWHMLKLVDWFGTLTSLLAIALFLLSISQGGSKIAWRSPVMIVMLIGSGVIAFIFIMIEWKFAELPMLPARLFKYGRSTNILLFFNIVIGWIFWGNLFVIPLYFQNIRGMSPGQAGLFILPITIAHGLTSALTGIIISIFNHYKPVIVTGAVCWSIAAVAKLWYDQQTPAWMIVIIGILDGVGVGCSLQPVLVGLFAGSDPNDRAILTGLRNFLRDMGGAIGTTVSGAILTNIVSGKLRTRFSQEITARLTSSAVGLKDFPLSDEDKNLISESYMNGIHAVFISYAVLIAVHLCACLCIEDYGLKGGNQDRKSREARGNSSQPRKASRVRDTVSPAGEEV